MAEDKDCASSYFGVVLLSHTYDVSHFTKTKEKKDDKDKDDEKKEADKPKDAKKAGTPTTGKPSEGFFGVWKLRENSIKHPSPVDYRHVLHLYSTCNVHILSI